MELTILMPCLNEEETLGVCIEKAFRFIKENEIDGEVLVVDNGSIDSSPQIALKFGARLEICSQKGYGSVLRYGCEKSRGKYVIMGDSDDSYDFEHLMPFLEKLRGGYDLVMGNRFKGGIEKGAMPWLHKYIGNPILSFIGRLFFHSKINDFHCGLRGYNRENISKLNLQTTGMEYASEMVVKAEISELRITEVPTTLSKDGRSKPPHLRSFHDGWRHLKFLFMYAPNWLLLYPGIFILLIGALGSAILIAGQLNILNVTFSIHTLLYFVSFISVGINIISSFFIVKLYSQNRGFLPEKKSVDWNQILKEDKIIFGGFMVLAVGIILSLFALGIWKGNGFAELIPEVVMRITIPAVACIEIGLQMIFNGFIIGILKVK